MKVDVDALMAGELGQWLAAQSSMREAAVQKATNRWVWSAAIAAFPLAWIWIVVDGEGSWRLVLTAIAAIAVAIWGYVPIGEATKSIKIGINSAIAQSFGLSFEHDVESGHEFDAAKTYGLLPSYDRRGLEDNWFGELEGHSFSLYEVHLEERRGSGKNRRWVTVFRGALITMAFGRDFRSTTLLQRAGQHRKWLGLGGKKDTVRFSGHELAYVDQVHPAFEDSFDLYSDDAVQARVLAHPAYIEHLVALERAFHGDAVRALFHRGQVIIAVETKRLFESGSIKSHEDRERVEEAAEQFSTLARLALAMNQNERGRAIGSAGPDETRAVGDGFGRKR
ncbi:MAG: DUF3137 domain-containing protein [Pseudomonadota bacterium]